MPLAAAQAVHCPDSLRDYVASGPKFTTDIYGRSKVTCRYYDRGRVRGTIEVFFFRDFNKRKSCDSRVFRDADARSRKYQVYGYFTDENRRDDEDEEYWLDRLHVLIGEAEDWALPCDVERRTIRRPFDIRPASE